MQTSSQTNIENRMINVVQFLRRPGVAAYSVERLYRDIRQHLPADIRVETRVNQFFSSGIVGRLLDALLASRWQRDVNHITGDVHYLTFFLKRRRTVLTILDCIILEKARGIRRQILWLLWFWIPVRMAAQIVVISEATRQQLLKHVTCDPAKIKVIYNPLSEEFVPDPRPFQTAFPLILHIGTNPNKNLERHAAALEGICCRLVVVGVLSSTNVAVLEKHRIRYENVQNLSQNAVHDLYRNCDLLLFASTYEGFGLPIIEAQAVGRPVVTGNILSMPEVAGGAACLVDPFDTESIRQGVLRVINDADYRSQLIENGFANAKRFGVARIAQEYAEVYRDVHAQAQRRTLKT